MTPTLKKKYKKGLMWAAAVTSLALVLSIGNTYGRIMDWTSLELIYTPEMPAGYSSNCLSAAGQQIRLSDWQADEDHRTITISVSRPDLAAPETIPTETAPVETLPTETAPTETVPTETEPTATESTNTTEPTDATSPTDSVGMAEVSETEPSGTEPEQTDPSQPVDDEQPATEPAEEETVPTEVPEETEPEDTELQNEVTVALDETAQKHLAYEVQVSEDTIQIQLQRVEEAPGLEQATTMTVEVQWFGLKGTFTVNMLPYGDAAVNVVEQEPTESQVITGLESVADVHDVMNAQRPVACVKLNLETQTDFTLTFMQDDELLQGVRWSLNGSDYTLLYDTAELMLNWPYHENWDGCVYLDFTDVLKPGQRPVIAVDATSYPRREFKPVATAAPEATGLILKTSSLPHTILVQPKWGAAKLQVVKIERLAKDAQEQLVYMQDATLTASVSNSGIVLTPTVAKVYPEPGSYRLVAQWVWNELVVEEQTLYFFVNSN